MLQKTISLEGFGRLDSNTSGLIYYSFLTGDQLGLVAKEVKTAFDTSKESKIDGKVGVAYERYSNLYICGENKQMVPSLRQSIEDKIFSDGKFPQYSDKWCASLVKFRPLDGMTSHRDYSYNKLMLGTLVLDGDILFGSHLFKRDGTYNPSNIVLANKGDLIALKAPNETSITRPFFSIFSPGYSLVMRIWMRDPSKCPSCSGEKYG